jgi:hypothetical protein
MAHCQFFPAVQVEKNVVRRPESFARGGPQREAYDSVLIVCEGGKCEPSYLTRLRDVHRLSNANIRITPANGTDPLSVVAFAKKEYNPEKFDRVYCVFDRDEHPSFDAALDEISKQEKFYAIISWPCFEFWVLLHFRYSAAPIHRAKALKDVIRCYPTYSKGSKSVFDDLSPRLQAAITHAKRLVVENNKNGSTNPATRMHELVEYLINLKA